MNLVCLSTRSLFFRWRQYVSLFIVCAIGTGVSLFLLFLVGGMLDSLSMKARIYYGGNFMFIGGKDALTFDDCRPFVDKLSDIFPEDAVISPRLEFLATSSFFYYEGDEISPRVVKGVDFEKEKELFSNFNYIEGSADVLRGTNGVLISDGIARNLNASVGDSITFVLKTTHGYTNTVPLIVKGIFIDSSVFGFYTSYLDIDFLRDSYCSSKFYANRIGIFFPERKVTEKDTVKYQTLLEKEFNMYSLVDNKYDFYNPLIAGEFDEPTYALIPLNANLDDLSLIIDAMKIISLFIIISLIMIIVVGVSSTCRVIAMKRINEIGIYKAMGMGRKSVNVLLLFEVFLLLLGGCFSGMVVCKILCLLIQKFRFSFIPAFDVFLSNGHLVPLPYFVGVFFVFSFVIVTTVCAVMFSVRDAVKITPVQALSVTE